jgi:hypothetical protein
MIIFKENQLTEGADTARIQKQVIIAIDSNYAKDIGMRTQHSSDKKVYLGECLGAMTSIAIVLNPMGDHWPGRDRANTPLDKDAQTLYKKLTDLIKEFNMVYTKDYGDSK